MVAGGKAPWRGTPWGDKDTRNFGNEVVRAEIVAEISSDCVFRESVVIGVLGSEHWHSGVERRSLGTDKS